MTKDEIWKRLTEVNLEISMLKGEMRGIKEVVDMCREKMEKYKGRTLELDEEMMILEEQFEDSMDVEVTLDPAYSGGRRIDIN